MAVVCRQALEALLSNVEQPQSTSTRRRRGIPSSLPSQEKVDREVSDACDAMAVSAASA